MRKPFLFSSLALLAIAISFSACKKVNGIDNEDEIQTPYSVYFSDSAGVLYNTNDGEVIKKLVFPADGYPSRAFAITGPNHMVWVKANAHFSNNSGRNFNPTYLFVNPAAYNQSALLYAKDQERVYLAGTQYRGVSYNEKNGELEEWDVDNEWDETIVDPISITSFTQLNNGVICSYDDINNRFFVKDNKGDKWSETVIDTNVFKHHLGSISLASYKNIVVAIDSSATLGVWYSQNNGGAWSQFSGLPANTRVACAGAPFNEELFVGTYYNGLYRTQGGVLIPSMEGLDQNTIVRGIKGKLERYKNDSERRVVYLTTNNGIYRSFDVGRNWVKIKEGNFINIY